MKNINKIFNIITVYMFTMLIIMMSVTFLSDYLSSINWFGDTFVTRCGWSGRVEHMCWGSRHLIYVYFNFFMFCLSTIRLIVSLNHCVKESKENEH